MLKEAFEFLTNIGAKAESIQIINLDEERDDKFCYVNVGGNPQLIKIPPLPRKHYVSDVESMLDACRMFSSEDFLVRLFVNPAQLVLLLDDEDRRDVIICPLLRSDQYKTLVSVDRKPKTQLEVVRILAFDIGVGAVDSTVISSFRQLRFRRDTAGHGDLKQTKQSLGKSVEAVVESYGSDALPECIAMQIPAFKNGGVASTTCLVNVYVDVDVEAQLFRLCVAPNAFDEMEQTVVNRIADYIADAGIECLRGKA